MSVEGKKIGQLLSPHHFVGFAANTTKEGDTVVMVNIATIKDIELINQYFFENPVWP